MNTPSLHVVRAPSPGIAVDEKIVSKPQARRKAVIEFIRSAERSLLLSIFRCDDLLVLHELAEAVARGVNVEVLVTGRAKGWGKRLDPMAGCLFRMGATVHRFNRTGTKYHAKYMVADNETALIGTLNLTRKCFRRTRDFLLVTHDQDVVAALSATFRADISGTRAPATGRLIVGPDNSRDRIELILGNARQSIKILDHKLSDPGILALLRDCRRKGVSVEVNSGIPSGTLVPHGRLIIVDNSIAVFGSFALSQKSLDARRELAIVIDRPELVAKLQRQFEVKAIAAAAHAAA